MIKTLNYSSSLAGKKTIIERIKRSIKFSSVLHIGDFKAEKQFLPIDWFNCLCCTTIKVSAGLVIPELASTYKGFLIPKSAIKIKSAAKFMISFKESLFDDLGFC